MILLIPRAVIWSRGLLGQTWLWGEAKQFTIQQRPPTKDSIMFKYLDWNRVSSTQPYIQACDPVHRRVPDSQPAHVTWLGSA